MFTHEARAALLPVEAAAVVVNAQNGVEAVFEQKSGATLKKPMCPASWSSTRWTTPKAGGGGGLKRTSSTISHERWGRTCVPVQMPISDAGGFHGVVDLVTMEAFYYTPGGDGRGKITGEIPAASLVAQAKAARSVSRAGRRGQR